jgi:uncharacterized protein involved in exopolysaccharide biosynthesis
MAKPIFNTRPRPSSDSDLPPRRRPPADPISRLPTAPPPTLVADEPVFDLPRMLEMLLFPLRCVRRHTRLALGTLAAFVALGTVGFLAMPQDFVVESKILTRRNMVLPALGNPRRTVPTESDAPARLANEVVTSRENLIEVIKATGLLTGWPRTLPATTQAIEYIRQQLKGERDERERYDVLVKQLQRRIYVLGGDDREGMVTIGARWSDPALALKIAKKAQDRFLAQRYEQDVSLVQVSVGILGRYVERAGSNMTAAMDELRSMPGVKVSLPEVSGYAVNARTAARSRAVTAEQSRLQTALQNVRNVLAQQEAGFAGRQTEANAKLADLETKYGPNHPEVMAARGVAEQAAAPWSSLATLRREEGQLVAQLARIGTTVAEQPDVSAELALQRQGFEKLLRQRSDTIEDPRITNARSQLKIATTTYEDLLDRQEAAKIELETARAAFKYRYVVTTPPQLPKEPRSSTALLLLLGGVVCGGCAAVFLSTTRDVVDGRLLESWQIQRQVGLPLLGEIQRG